MINENYPKQAWITAMLAGTLLALSFCHDFAAGNIFTRAILMFFWFTLFSVPAYILYFIAFNFFTTTGIPVLFKKLIIAFVGAAVFFTTLYLLGIPMSDYYASKSPHVWYCTAIFIGTFSCKMERSALMPQH